METGDFRIGNYVMNSKNKIITIYTIDRYGINGYYDEGIGGMNYEYGGLYDDIKPISITKEWLQDSRFKDDSDNYIAAGRQGFFIAEAQGNDSILLYRVDIGLPNNPLRIIEYVHELQNLFFALTKKEIRTHKYNKE